MDEPAEPIALVGSDTPVAAAATTVGPGASSRVTSWPMWVLGFVIMIDQIDQYIVRGAAPQLQKAFGIDDLGIGLLISAFVVVNGLVTVPAGYLADRWNRTRTIGHTVVAWSGITMITAAAGNFATLLGLRALLGFGQAVTEPSAASLLSDYYPTEERGRVFSNQQIMGFSGAALGIAIGGTVAATLGWRWAFLVVGFPGLVIAFLCYRLREPPHGYADKLHLGVDEWEEPEKVPLFDHGFRTFVREMLQGIRQDFGVIWSIPTLRFALVGVSALMFTVSGVGTWLPKFHQLYSGMTDIQAANVVGALLIVGGVPGLLLGGRLADRYMTRIQGARVVIPAYCIWGGITFFTGSYLPMPGVASVGLQLIGIFWITMAIPALRASMADAVPSHLRGAGFGAFNLASIVFGAAAAPVLVGWLSDIWSLRAAFLVVSIPVYIGAWVLYQARTHLDEDAMKIFEAVVRAMQQEQDRAAD